MSPRRWLLPGVLLTLFTAAVILPATDIGREWLLERAVSVADHFGYQVAFAHSSGNPWFGIELSDVSATGPGIDLSAGSLAVGYFLPSLITGDLPLSLAVAGVRGNLDPANLTAVGASGSGGQLVSPRLRDLAIRDVAVVVDGSPWTLPALDLEDLTVESTEGALSFAVTAAGAEGQARLTGDVRLAPWRLELEIADADATLARHWWDGVESGRLEGSVVADSDGIRARGRLSGGGIRYLNERFESLSGPLSYQGGVVEADLAGSALGGPVSAEITVNIPASYWQGSLQGRPDLDRLARWLAAGALDPAPLGIDGRAQIELQASGWRAVTLRGRGSGEGAILGYPLADLLANFAFDSALGASLEASANLAGGPVVATLNPGRGSSRLHVAAQGVEVADDLEGEWDLTASVAPGGTTGRLEGALEGSVAGRRVAVEADADLDEDGVQLYVRGEDALGATAEGAAVIADGAVEGRFMVDGLSLPGLAAPVDLSLRGDGPLDAVPLELVLTSLPGGYLELFGHRVEEDFSGAASGLLVGDTVREMSGEFGPLAFEGVLGLAPLAFDGEYRLDTVRAEGSVEASFASNGSLLVSPERLQGDGVLHLERLAAAGAAVGEMELRLEANASPADGLLLRLASSEMNQEGEAAVEVRVTERSLRIDARRPPLTIAKRPVALDGSIDVPPEGSPQADVTVRSDRLLIDLEPSPDGHLIQLIAQPGLELGAFTLRQPVEVAGYLAHDLSTGHLQGQVSGEPFTADYSREDERLVVDSSLGTDEGFRLAFAPGPEEWSFDGSLRLDPLAAAVGLPLVGNVSGAMTSGGSSSGELRAEAVLAGVPLDLRLNGQGSRFLLEGSAHTAGVAWQLSGSAPAERLLEDLDLSAASDFGTVGIEGVRLEGSGQLPSVLGPLATAGGSWSLQGDVESSQATLTTDSSEATLDWSDGVRLDAAIHETFELAEVAARLDATVDWRAGEPGEVDGTLAVAGERLAVAGDLGSLRLSGELDARNLSRELLGSPLFGGVLDVSASVPLGEPGAATADLSWRSGGANLEGNWSGGALTVIGPGVEASYDSATFSLAAQRARLDPFLAGSAGALAVNGSLTRNLQSGWEGSLSLQSDLPLPGSPAATLELEGRGSSLGVRARAATDAYEAVAEGSVFPTLDLDLEAAALDGRVTFAGGAAGTLQAPVLEGVLNSARLDLAPLAIPALSLAVEFSPDGTAVVRGDGLALRLDEEDLSGGVDLTLELSGRPHSLSGEIAGTVANPEVTLNVSGDTAVATAIWQGTSGSASVDLDTGQWLPEPLSSRDWAHLDLTLDNSLEWTAFLSAPIEALAEPLMLRATLRGNADDYGGSAHLSHTEVAEDEATLAEATIEGGDGGWRVVADLDATEPAALRPLLPIASQLDPRGTATITNNLIATLDGGISGSLGGQTLGLVVNGDTASGVDVTGALAGFALDAKVDSGGLEFRVANEQGLDLDGRIGWDEGLGLTLAGEGVEAAGSYQLKERTGELNASLQGAVLEARARPAEGVAGGARVTATLRGPTGNDYQAATTVLIAEDGVLVESLTATGGDEAWRGHLGGQLWPDPGLTGSYSARPSFLEEGLNGRLELDGPSLGQPRLSLEESGVALLVGWMDGEWRASLTGNGELAGVSLQGDLSWSRTAGFGGRADLSVPASIFTTPLPYSALRVNLDGDGGLSAGLELESAAGEPLAGGEIRFSPTPWQDPGIAGELQLAGNMEQLWPAYPGEPLALTAELTIDGTIASPVLSGPVALAGALGGNGRLHWQGDDGALELMGERFSASFGINRTGEIDAALDVVELDLQPLWPAAAGTVADLDARFGMSSDGHLSGEVSSLTARRGASLLEGSASLDETLQASVRLDLDLGDVPLEQPELSGSLEGTVELQAAGLGSVTAGALRGDLRLEGAEVEGSGTSISGQVSLAGRPGDPLLTLDLRASGAAAGDLLVSTQPARSRMSIASDLSWGQVSGRIDVESTPAALAGQGRIELPGGAFTLSAPGEGRDLVLLGEGDYREWRLSFDADTLAVNLRADLATLGAGASGQINATAGGDGEGRWLSGEATGLAWDGIGIGDVGFSSSGPGAPVRLEGESIEASIDPLGGPEWQVYRLELPLSNDLMLTGTGTGSGASLTAQLLLGGSLGGASVRFPLSLERTTPGSLAFSGNGDLLEGRLSIDGTLDGQGWQGSLSATAIQALGLEVDLTGQLSGEPLSPELAVAASGESGWATIGADGVFSLIDQSLEALVASPHLADPVTLRLSSEGNGSLTIGSGSSSLQVADLETAPRPAGAVRLDAGNLSLDLIGTEADGLSLRLAAPPLPGLVLEASIAGSRLTEPATFLDSPLLFRGTSATSGEVQLGLAPLQATIRGLSYRGESVGFDVSGVAGPEAEASLTGALRLQGGIVSTLGVEAELPFALTLEETVVALESNGELGSVELELDLEEGSGSVAADLQLGEGALRGSARFVPGEGPSGSFTADALPFFILTDEQPLLLTGRFEVTPESLGIAGQLEAPGGSLQANGTIGLALLLPTGIAPHGASTRRLEMQLGTVDLSTLPWVARRLPHLQAPLSGFLRIFGDRVVGRLIAPELTVAGDPLPLSVDLNGTAEEVTISGLLADSPVQITLDEGSVSALVNLDRFPLHLLAQAATGPLDVSAEVSGVGRLELPLAEDGGADVEIATELVRLERAGVVTSGNVSLTFRDGELVVNEASFAGAGTWQASGAVRRDLLDLSLTATDADFGPLLGLVPLFARYQVGASGSLELDTSGTLADPVVTLTTPGLEFGIAGSSYRLAGGEATLQDELLELAATVEGIEPLTGRLEIGGSGQLDLLPLSLGEARFEAVGRAHAPGLGEIEQFQATITGQPEEPLRMQASGSLGQPFTLEGTLLPFDLTLSGENLSISLPYLLLASAQVDTRLRMQWLDSLRLSGHIGVDQALFELGIRPPGDGEPTGPNPVAEQVVFDDVEIEAPGRVRFVENFGSAETSLDLRLSGSAARPALSGVAQVLRGTIRFSGRDFGVVSAQARFDPARGVLPIVDVTAVTTFEVDQVLPPDESVRFVSPDRGSRFEVILSFTGELESTPEAQPPFRLDLSPALSTDALIQEVRADGTTSAPRSLSEPELLSLITLGRLDLEAPLASEAGLAGAVAEGAIDTAVDLLLVSELQNALAEALGVDLVEIDTTPISSIFGRSQASEPFSVSLRLGGYLSDEVFASYRIGTFDDVQGLYALTNEVNLVYELGPVEIDLAGRVNFEDTAVPTPDAAVSATVRYDFGQFTALEGGVDLTDERQQLRFGVTLRW